MSPDEFAERLRRIETERIPTLELRFERYKSKDETENTNIKQDLEDIKTSLEGLTKIIWGGFALLFTSFIAALGILISQGGIH